MRGVHAHEDLPRRHRFTLPHPNLAHDPALGRLHDFEVVAECGWLTDD